MNTQELMGGDQPFPMVYRNMTYLKLETLGTLSQGPFVHAIFMFSSLPNSSIYTFFFFDKECHPSTLPVCFQINLAQATGIP